MLYFKDSVLSVIDQQNVKKTKDAVEKQFKVHLQPKQVRNYNYEVLYNLRCLLDSAYL